MTDQNLYRLALARSWKILWHEPHLWLFGLLAAILGQFGLTEFITSLSATNFAQTSAPFWWQILTTPFQFAWPAHLAFDQWLWVIWSILILLAIIIFFFYSALVAQGALIYSISRLDQKKSPKNEKAWHIGVRHSGRLLGLVVTKRVVFFGLTIFVILATIAGWGILALILATILGMITALLSTFAAGYTIIEEQTYGESLKNASKLFAKHWLVSLEIGAILFLIFVGISALFITLITILLPPAFYFFTALAGLSGHFIFTLAIWITLIVFFLILAWLAALLSVFTTATWTILFMHMHRTGIVAHLSRVWRRFRL